tara:strand:+ start:1465 stop:2952 length:1488 start_codon:yes stop_codon:yes gene_type:complete
MKYFLSTLFCIAIAFVANAQLQIGSNFLASRNDEYLGVSSDLNTKGDVFVIGTPNNNDSCGACGSIKVFQRQANTWLPLGQVVYGSPFDFFGYKVDLNAQGNVLAVSSSTAQSFLGIARVYELINNQWIQKGSDFTPSGNDYLLGADIELSADGNTVVIGVPQGRVNATTGSRGRVYIYEWVNNSWSLKGSPILGGRNTDNIGQAVSISADGNVVAVGAPTANVGSLSYAGKAAVYVWNGTAWVIKGNPFIGLDNYHQLGIDVHLSGDGNVFALGNNVPINNTQISNKIQVFTYDSVNAVWQQRGSDILPENFGDGWGKSFELSYDGTVLVGGAENNAGTAFNSGHMRVFEYNSNNWHQRGYDIDGTQRGRFGHEVAIDSLGETISGASSFDTNHPSYAQVWDVSFLVSIPQSESNHASKINIFPNPFHNQFTIEANSTILSYQLYDINGRLIQLEENPSGTSRILNTLSLPNGIYFLQLQLENQQISSHKLIKN